MATSGKTIARNTLFLYGRMLLVMGVTFFTARIILQSLGATDYGVYNVVGGVVTMLGFLNSALSASTSRFLIYELGVGDKNKLSNTFAASLNLHIVIALVVLVFGETIGLCFFYNKLVIPADRMVAAFWVYQFSIVSTMMSFTQVPYNASLISHENMSIYAYVGLYEAFSKLIIAYLIIHMPGDRLICYGLLLMVNSIAIQIFYRLYTKRKYDECRFKLVRDKSLYKTLLNYSGWDLFGNMACVCQNQCVNILLNVFFGPTVNAARAIALQIQNAVKMFTKNFMVAVRPQVVKNFAEKRYDEMYSLSFTTVRLSLLLVMALIIPLIFEIDFVLRIWLRDGYPTETALFARIILFSALIDTMESGQNMAFHAIGRIKAGNIICGSIMILSLPLGWLLLKIGMDASIVFWVIIITNVMNVFLTLIIMKGYFEFSIKSVIKGTYIPAFVVGILSIIAPMLICRYMEEGVLRFFFNLVITEVSLFFFGWHIAITNSEKNKIINILHKRMNKL